MGDAGRKFCYDRPDRRFLLLLFLYERGQVYGKKRESAVLSSGWLALMLVSVVLFGVFGAYGFLYANF